jgi:hypothetical protein
VKVTEIATIKGRGIVTIIDKLPAELHEGQFVRFYDRRWRVVGIEMHAHGREHANGQPAGLLLQGDAPLPSVGDVLTLDD